MLVPVCCRLSPPVLPLCSLKEIQLSTDKFFRMEPSEITNGCFLSILTREVRKKKSQSMSYFGIKKQQQSLVKASQEPCTLCKDMFALHKQLKGRSKNDCCVANKSCSLYFPQVFLFCLAATPNLSKHFVNI